MVSIASLAANPERMLVQHAGMIALVEAARVEVPNGSPPPGPPEVTSRARQILFQIFRI
jgi:hypothetical protein